MVHCDPMRARHGVVCPRAAGPVAATMAAGLLTLSWCGCGGEAGSPPQPEAGAPGSSDEGQAAGASRQPGESLGGQYTVPVEEALATFATYRIEGIRFEQRDGEVELSYRLPELLHGDERRVSFRGSGQLGAARLDLSSGDGQAVCRRLAEQVRCDEVLAGVEAPVVAASARVSARCSGPRSTHSDRCTV